MLGRVPHHDWEQRLQISRQETEEKWKAFTPLEGSVLSEALEEVVQFNLGIP